jgi:hypothetical protein
MNTFATVTLYGALVLGDLLLLRILWLGNRAEGFRSRTAAWLFFTGTGIGGLVADGILRGHHPFVAVAIGIGAGLALASLMRSRAAVHGPRADLHAEPL